MASTILRFPEHRVRCVIVINTDAGFDALQAASHSGDTTLVYSFAEFLVSGGGGGRRSVSSE